MKRVIINKFIVADPEVCHGKLTFKGTRIMVWQILEMLAAGESIKEILENYPSLKQSHIRAALDMAAKKVSKERYGFFNDISFISG